ncbi:hypothetical protein RR46_10516 [Papilio xuthus]|uniref:Uncharacterized protein n=1 Tax=Papilio xuthus TaxID=66420 RepID=A0A194PIL1_PAPXU|nr:hypothetical protein RR46_10516 [Papilio xuthus]
MSQARLNCQSDWTPEIFELRPSVPPVPRTRLSSAPRSPHAGPHAPTENRKPHTRTPPMNDSDEIYNGVT